MVRFLDGFVKSPISTFFLIPVYAGRKVYLPLGFIAGLGAGFAPFGLAFFINTLHVSSAKSVLAGSLTLAILVLPTVIRASEEALAQERRPF